MLRLALDSADLGRRYGIHFMQSHGRELQGLMLMDPTERAYDAQPALVTQANAGIPSLFTTYVDPKIIEILVRPTKAAELYGETRKVLGSPIPQCSLWRSAPVKSSATAISARTECPTRTWSSRSASRTTIRPTLVGASASLRARRKRRSIGRIR